MDSISPVTIAIVEDDQPLREVLEALFGTIERVVVRGAFNSVGSARKALAQGMAVDIVLIDLSLPDADGWELIDYMQAKASLSRILIMSGRRDEYTLDRARDPVVRGFIDKTSISLDGIKQALATVARGERYFSPSISAAMKQFRSDTDAWVHCLSQRERELLPFLASGEANALIGEKVGVSAATVHVHRKNIMRKLRLHSTVELVLWAFNRGIIRPGVSSARKTSAKVGRSI